MRSEEIKNQMNQNNKYDIFGKIMSLEIDFTERDGNKFEDLYMIIKEGLHSSKMLKICLFNNNLHSYFSEDMSIGLVNRIVKKYQRAIEELEEENNKSLLSK